MPCPAMLFAMLLPSSRHHAVAAAVRRIEGAQNVGFVFLSSSSHQHHKDKSGQPSSNNSSFSSPLLFIFAFFHAFSLFAFSHYMPSHIPRQHIYWYASSSHHHIHHTIVIFIGNTCPTMNMPLLCLFFITLLSLRALHHYIKAYIHRKDI